MRLFFALWPPRETAIALEGWARGCEGRAMPAANIHLTLAFLGEADAAKAAAAAQRARGQRHDLPIERAGYWRHNRIIWAGPREAPAALLGLVESLHRELRNDGFTLEDRPFAAHVTLLRKATRPVTFADLPATGWPVREFLMVESIHGRYRSVEAFQLR